MARLELRASLCLCFLISASSIVAAEKLFFAFGDSWADTGNRPSSGPRIGSGWKYPYGITWPKHPAGRYCDGHIQTDFYADILGIPSPTPYLHTASLESTANGINFAVAGSGITFAYGLLPLAGQVDNLELYLRTDPYSKSELARSLTLVSNIGNDYTAFNGTSQELVIYIRRVVEGMATSLGRLYDFGLRDIMVANLAPLDCLPVRSYINDFKHCDNRSASFVAIHNALLLGAIENLNKLPGARFIILDQFAAFSHLIRQAKAVGFTDGLAPCCQGISQQHYCGDVDDQGRRLYTVCKHRGKAVFWDTQHPTQTAWKYIVQLYTKHPDFILLADAPTLLKWLKIDEVGPVPVASPSPQPDASLASYEVNEALDALISVPDYSEALALLGSTNFELVLGNYSQKLLTVFLPNNQAFLVTPSTSINKIFSEDRVNEVLLYHAVNECMTPTDLKLSSQ